MNLAKYWIGKLSGLLQSLSMARSAGPLSITAHEIKKLKKAAALQAGQSAPSRITPEEAAIFSRIREETVRLNRNNITRTQAYWRVFERRPELHWAFLAHMVSRNGGWIMTDLKGELLPELLPPKRAEAYFRFLERANALIFLDAYPQLQLYETGIERGRSLFHLLPQFGVSAFMRPAWETFTQERNSALITVALIINEQQHIEGHVVQNEYYRKAVLDTLAYHIQSLLQLNIIVFPYAERNVANAHSGSLSRPLFPSYRLAGLIMESFEDLHERIEVGKKLYGMLFGVPDISEGAMRFAASHPHTGSRADFWPQLYAPIRHSVPSSTYKEKLDGCTLRPGADRIYSPELTSVWKDVPVETPKSYDWFTDMSVFNYFESVRPPSSFELTNEYCFSLSKIELAVMAKQQLDERKEGS